MHNLKLQEINNKYNIVKVMLFTNLFRTYANFTIYKKNTLAYTTGKPN